MRRAAWSFALALAPLALPAHADEQLLALVTQVRQRGCTGHGGTPAPLRWSEPLARAAARIDKGEAPQQAVAQEGYRLTRIFHASFAGYRAAADVARTIAAKYCSAATDARLVDFAFHRQGSRWVVVFGAPFQLPQLADRRAAVQRVLALVNDARSRPRRCGDRLFEAAAPLQWDEQLEQAAARHAQDMARHAYVEHRGRDGSSPSERVTRAGYRWRSVGENVAAGQGTPEEVVEDWLESPGHCANLMSPDYTEMGVAFAVNLQAKQAVFWAQAFGRPKQ